jgi:hypothetical protein
MYDRTFLDVKSHGWRNPSRHSWWNMPELNAWELSHSGQIIACPSTRCQQFVGCRNADCLFSSNDMSCENIMKPGKSPSDLNASLPKFLKDYPFANARVMMKYFKISPITVNNILFRNIGFRKFSRRWVPYQFTAARKLVRANDAKALYRSLHRRQANSFAGIAVGSKS